MLDVIKGMYPFFFNMFDVGGVLVAAILGGMVARERRFDIVGFAVVAILSALGGGILRDTLLQAGPPVALTNPFYLSGALTGAFISYVLRLRGRWWNRFFIVADAFVVGAWAATGAVKTLDVGLGWIPAMMLGVTTAVGGGMIRDISVGRVPAIFGGNTLYATGALCGTIPAIILWECGEPSFAMWASALVGGGVCIAARWYKWVLPTNNDFTIQMTYVQLRSIIARVMRERKGGPGKNHSEKARKLADAILAEQVAQDRNRKRSEAVAAAEEQFNAAQEKAAPPSTLTPEEKPDATPPEA